MPPKNITLTITARRTTYKRTNFLFLPTLSPTLSRKAGEGDGWNQGFMQAHEHPQNVPPPLLRRPSPG